MIIVTLLIAQVVILMLSIMVGSITTDTLGKILAVEAVVTMILLMTMGEISILQMLAIITTQ